MNLADRKCIPCRGGMPPLKEDEARNYLSQLDKDWELTTRQTISREFRFPSFVEAIAFVNRVAQIAEEEDHHPDITINYRKVRLELTTHAIDGLSQNDFIIAAKADRLYHD